MHKITPTLNCRKLGSAMLAVSLAGCAAAPQNQEAAGKLDTKLVAHRSTLQINTADVKPVSPPKAESPKADLANGEKKADRPGAKDEIHLGTGIFVKPAPAAAPSAKPAAGDEVMLNFEGADLREVVKAIVVDFLRETYIMDTKVQGVVSLHTTSPIAKSALIPTLETVLRMNGAAIVKEEGLYKIVPAATAVRGSITPQLGTSNIPLQSGYTVQIVPLKFIAPKEMVKILEPFVSDASAVRIDEVRNLMILAGTERELRHLRETIEMFDIDWLAGMSVGLFTLQSVDVKTAVADLDKVFGGAAQNPLAGVVRLVPIERLNALLVVTQQPKYLEQAKIWIERMDRSGGASGGVRLFVYPVQNGQSEKLANLLNDVFSKSKSTTKTTPAATLAPGMAPAVANSTPVIPAPGAAPAAPAAAASAAPNTGGDSVSVSGDVRVIADKDNNALLILASPSDYEKIESAIRKLDVVPRQVLIDVTIAEVKLTGDLKFGLEWYFGSVKRANTGFDSGNGGRVGAAGGTYSWANTNVGAALNILQNDTRLKVISSPHIMVTDNQTAKIQVGDQVPTTSQTQTAVGTSTGIISSVQYLNTGILLSVTPHINAGGMVTMEINQEVSDAAKTQTSGIDSPTITRRAVQSTVVVKSGETMVLGGLIKDDNQKTTSGLPLLSQIPLVGGLFGSQGYTDNRTELVIMITPRVVVNTTQAREVTEEFRRKLSGLGELLDKSGKFEDKSKIDKNQAK